ncbi:MAG: ankyrin repeat domain-containing protein [Phycisphaerales bacterium]|nr:MAG: ankyrin repeat domain-containing protein [Phycisphaerales bacterium]
MRGPENRRNAVGGLAVAAVLLHASCATAPLLHQAARRGDVAQIDQRMKRGALVNAQDESGNTPLHYAYYHEQTEAVDRLMAYGADAGVRNHDGLTPAQMRDVGKAKRLLDEGVRLLNQSGEWTAPDRARPIYDELRTLDGQVVTNVIVAKTSRGEDRLCTLFLAVKLGIPGSEDRLNELLQIHGDKSMAEDFLNCGSQALNEGAHRWAESRGYTIGSGTGSHRVRWREF